MEGAKFRWLKALSNYAFVVMIFVGVLHWYNDGQIELVVNDPAAKAYWLQIRNLYEKLGWVSLALVVGLRVSYWTIEYVNEHRVMTSNKGD